MGLNLREEIFYRKRPNTGAQDRVGGASISDMFTTELLKTYKYKLIERSQIEQVLDEQALGLKGVTDSALAFRVGKMLGVDGVIVGTVPEYGLRAVGEYELPAVGINVRLIDGETGSIVWSITDSACSQDDNNDTASNSGGRICRDTHALNYQKEGRCKYKGCMDSSATNYDKDAIEAGECTYAGTDDNQDSGGGDECCAGDSGGNTGGTTAATVCSPSLGVPYLINGTCWPCPNGAKRNGVCSSDSGAGITVTSPSAPAPPPAPPATSCGCPQESQCVPCTGGMGRLFPCWGCECLGGC